MKPTLIVGTLILALFIGLYASTARADITSNLVGWYAFDEGSGTTATDSSGTGNGGTLVNSPGYSTGRVLPYAIRLNGTTQSATVNALANDVATGSVTMCAWINFASNYTSASSPMIVARVADAASTNDVHITFGQWFGPTNDGKFYMEVWNGTSAVRNVASQSSWTAGVWYFVCGTESTANGVKGYINGVLDGSATSLSGRGGTAATQASIGKSPVGTASFFAGSIDEVKVFARELTATEIADLYASYPVPQKSIISQTSGVVTQMRGVVTQ